VAAWMARRLGLQKVHPQRGWEALKRIDWSPQAPRPRHARAAGPEEQAAFRGLEAAVAQAKAAHPVVLQRLVVGVRDLERSSARLASCGRQVLILNAAWNGARLRMMAQSTFTRRRARAMTA
jgi:Winged helix-turn helix